MMTLKLKPHQFGLALALVIVGSAHISMAVDVTFETPNYTTGNLIGQDSWVRNAYVGPANVNGDVLVSSSSPLDGGQSLQYSQTSVPAGFGASDTSKAQVITVSSVSGVDVSVSYLISANGNAQNAIGQAGLFLSHNAAGGLSPIFARLNGTQMEVGNNGSPGGVAVVPNFTYFAGDVLKVTYDVDFDTSTYDVSVTNQTFGGFEFTQTFNFLGAFVPEGPNSEYIVDVGTLLRSGTAKIDSISLIAGTGPVVSDFTWNIDGSGSWNQSANWSPQGVPGSRPGLQTAMFGNKITSNQTVFNNSSRSVNGIVFDNTHSYFVAGTGSIDLEADTSGPTPVNPTIEVVNGHHVMQLPVNLLEDTTVTATSGASLDFNNQIDLNGNTLTTSGTVRLNHSTIGGGSVVNLGSLAAASATGIDGDLVSLSKLVIGLDSNGAGSFNVSGDATLSGVLDVALQGSPVLNSTYTIVTARGLLDVSKLALDSSDSAYFRLATTDHVLTLTYVAAVPEPNSLTLILIGQQGWIRNAYVGVPNVNGDVTVSATSPIDGAQSFQYTQTSIPAGFGAGDVSKRFVAFGTADGTTAVDLTASVQIKADANSFAAGQLGLFLSPDAFNGLSPIGFKLDGADSSTNTGNIQVLHTTGFVNAAPYVPNHTLEFQIGVNFDNGGDYEISYRDITAGGALTPLVGPGTGGRFAFFNAPNVFPADGDSVTYTVDVGTLLRGGGGQIDNIVVNGDDFTQAVWQGVSGDWNQNTNWIPQLVPNVTTGNGQIAIFGNRNTVPQTVFSNATQTVNGLRFDSPNKYALAGAGTLELKANTSGGAVNPTINVLQGNHELQSPLNILNDTTVTVGAGALLDVNGNVSLGGHTMTTSGALNLNVGVSGGGTISNSGALGTAGSTPVVANLVSTGTLRIDLGPANTDRFDITGNANLSGLLDVTLEPGFSPSGSYTLLTASGTLSAAGLALDPSDAATFSLSVVGTSLVLAPKAGVPGDYNGNGTVDAADYVVWRKHVGQSFQLSNEVSGQTPGTVTQEDYTAWRARFGNTAGNAAGSAMLGVPEPTSVGLALIMLGLGAGFFRRTSV
jgi:hypothetical protein